VLNKFKATEERLSNVESSNFLQEKQHREEDKKRKVLEAVE
jgi:hypothetical protein